MSYVCLSCDIIPIYIHRLTISHYMISILLYMSPIFKLMPSILYHMISITSGRTIQKRLENKYVFNKLIKISRENDCFLKADARITQVAWNWFQLAFILTRCCLHIPKVTENHNKVYPGDNKMPSWMTRSHFISQKRQQSLPKMTPKGPKVTIIYPKCPRRHPK